MFNLEHSLNFKDRNEERTEAERTRKREKNTNTIIFGLNIFIHDLRLKRQNADYSSHCIKHVLFYFNITDLFAIQFIFQLKQIPLPLRFLMLYVHVCSLMKYSKMDRTMCDP